MRAFGWTWTKDIPCLINSHQPMIWKILQRNQVSELFWLLSTVEKKKHYSVSILVYIFHTPYLWISRVEPSSWRCLQMHHLCICHIGHCTHQILPKKKRALFTAVEKNRKSNHPNKVQSISQCQSVDHPKMFCLKKKTLSNLQKQKQIMMFCWPKTCDIRTLFWVS